MNRSAEDVIRDHLELAKADDFVTDLKRHFSEDCVLLTSFGMFKGHEGIKKKIDLQPKG